MAKQAKNAKPEAPLFETVVSRIKWVIFAAIVFALAMDFIAGYSPALKSWFDSFAYSAGTTYLNIVTKSKGL